MVIITQEAERDLSNIQDFIALDSPKRAISHGKYLIFYRIRGDIVEIIHILNGARDYEAFLSAEDE